MLGTLIGAGLSLAGGLIGREAQEDQRAKNEALQREFAQNSVQWRVADAKKAGIHPLYAMGAPTMSPAVSVQGDPLGASLSSMGADVGRAMTAMNTPGEKLAGAASVLQDMQVTNMALRNDLLASQIRKLNQAGNPPGVPIGDAERVPTNAKLKENPRMVIGGEEVIGDPGFSPTNELSDAYGDENPVVQYIYGPMKMYYDWKYNNAVRDREIPRGYNNWNTHRTRGGGAGW